MKNDWKEYLNKFENQILLPLFESGDFLIKPEPVPLRAGKLRKSQFAIFVGADFKYKDILSFNYYGLFKPSTALLQTKPKKGLNTIKAPVIHFSSIKIDHIEKQHRELLLDFVNFKKFLVALRWKK